MATRKIDERPIYSQMLIAAVLTSAAIIGQQTDDQVIARYKQMLQVLRVKGTQ